mmetsp:Transcript_79164/g.244292  ORF Transcript_79164/g.244292 Transcript_79164/m.244292 type:complete len:236 (-) Transcript_79164:1107-1814(-)
MQADAMMSSFLPPASFMQRIPAPPLRRRPILRQARGIRRPMPDSETRRMHCPGSLSFMSLAGFCSEPSAPAAAEPSPPSASAARGAAAGLSPSESASSSSSFSLSLSLTPWAASPSLSESSPSPLSALPSAGPAAGGAATAAASAGLSESSSSIMATDLRLADAGVAAALATGAASASWALGASSPASSLPSASPAGGTEPAARRASFFSRLLASTSATLTISLSVSCEMPHETM